MPENGRKQNCNEPKGQKFKHFIILVYFLPSVAYFSCFLLIFFEFSAFDWLAALWLLFLGFSVSKFKCCLHFRTKSRSAALNSSWFFCLFLSSDLFSRIFRWTQPSPLLSALSKSIFAFWVDSSLDFYTFPKRISCKQKQNTDKLWKKPRAY